MALSLLGGLAMLVFSIQILILAFKTSTAWGLISLFIPFGILVYVAKHWAATKTPFLRSVAAFVVAMIGSAISVFGAVSSAAVQ
jgi:uncharacterized membrane protein